MPDQVIDKAWSDVQPNDRIRWATPRFIKYGVVLTRKGPSMTVDFCDDDRPRAIPDARYYFVQGKLNPDADEHLVVIAEITDEVAQREVMKPFLPDPDDNEWVTVPEACEIIRMEQKQFRRYVRRGVILAYKKDDRWQVNREALLSTASKNGWI